MNSAGGSFGLSFGLAFAGAILLATLSFAFTHMADASDVLSKSQQQQVADALEDDAEVMSNTQLEQQLKGQRPAVKAEILEHQHRCAPPRASGRAADPGPGRADRPVQLVRDDASSRIRSRRRRWRGWRSAELGLDGAVHVAVDVVGADQVDDAVGLEHRRAPAA